MTAEMQPQNWEAKKRYIAVWELLVLHGAPQLVEKVSIV